MKDQVTRLKELETENKFNARKVSQKTLEKRPSRKRRRSCDFCHPLLLDAIMPIAANIQDQSNGSELLSDVANWLPIESASLWPALLGSLSSRRRRCNRESCVACESGEQHQSYVLYGRAHGRRVAVYVPEELVPEVQRSLDNGRALQNLLHHAAPRVVEALKRGKRARLGAKVKD